MEQVEDRRQSDDAAGTRRSRPGRRRFAPTAGVDDDDGLCGVSRGKQLAKILRIAFRKDTGWCLAFGNAVAKRHEARCRDARRDRDGYRERARARASHRIRGDAGDGGRAEKENRATLGRTFRLQWRLTGHDLRRVVQHRQRIPVSGLDRQIRGTHQNRPQRLRRRHTSEPGGEERAEEDEKVTPWKENSAVQAESP